MNFIRRIASFFRRKPGMIGTPPSQRPIWHNEAAHARDFAERYAEPLNYHVENRMSSQPARVKRKTDSGPPTQVETGYMILRRHQLAIV